MLRRMLIGAASLALAACASTGGGPPIDRTAFVHMAASSDLFEIQSSQLALSRSQNPAIRQFAGMMIAEHSAMSQQLAEAAQADGIPPALYRMLPPQAAILRRLDGAADFDRAYAREQVAAHELALRLHQDYAARGAAPSLRAAAAAAAPAVYRHLLTVRSWPR